MHTLLEVKVHRAIWIEGRKVARWWKDMERNSDEGTPNDDNAMIEMHHIARNRSMLLFKQHDSR